MMMMSQQCTISALQRHDLRGLGGTALSMNTAIFLSVESNMMPGSWSTAKLLKQLALGQ